LTQMTLVLATSS